MTHLSLFSGIGGLDLAAEAAGFQTVGQCEWANYPTKVLEKHWPDVPRWRDIRTLTRESFYERTGLRTVDVISGGFPCQPFSVAGKQKGKGDDRYLWPEMLRVIRELTPRWVVGENVPGILRIAATDIVSDLEREGYNIVVLDFEAASVGAPHRRERIAFVGNRESVCEHSNCSIQCAIKKIQEKDPQSYGIHRAFSDSNRAGQQRRKQHKPFNDGGKSSSKATCKYGEIASNPCGSRCNWNKRREYAQFIAKRSRWPAEPDVGRVANGVPHRVDRLRALGNAVVP